MTLLQSGGGLLAAELVPWIAAAALGIAALALVGVAVAQPARRRPYVAAGVVTCGLLAIAHGTVGGGLLDDLGLDARATAAAARFAAYAVVLPLVLGLLGRAAGLRRWGIAALGVGGVVHVAALLGWVLLDGDLAIGALATAALAALGAAFGVGRAVRTGGPRARRLLVVRFAGLVGLVWAIAVLAVGLSPTGVDLLDGYTAAVLGGYLDVVFGTGLGALLAVSGGALDELTGATVPAELGDAVAAPAPDDDQRGVAPGVRDGDRAAADAEDDAVEAGSNGPGAAVESDDADADARSADATVGVEPSAVPEDSSGQGESPTSGGDSSQATDDGSQATDDGSQTTDDTPEAAGDSPQATGDDPEAAGDGGTVGTSADEDR